MLSRLLDHLIWADARTAASLEATPDPEAMRLWGHILGAEATWLARLNGVEPAVAIWPTLDLGAARRLAEHNHEALRRWAEAPEATRAKAIHYTNSRGDAFTNTVTEILHHVVLHGMYHRGQVALLIRTAGGTPIATDLIAYLREG